MNLGEFIKSCLIPTTVVLPYTKVSITVTPPTERILLRKIKTRLFLALRAEPTSTMEDFNSAHKIISEVSKKILNDFLQKSTLISYRVICDNTNNSLSTQQARKICARVLLTYMGNQGEAYDVVIFY